MGGIFYIFRPKTYGNGLRRSKNSLKRPKIKKKQIMFWSDSILNELKAILGQRSDFEIFWKMIKNLKKWYKMAKNQNFQDEFTKIYFFEVHLEWFITYFKQKNDFENEILLKNLFRFIAISWRKWPNEAKRNKTFRRFRTTVADSNQHLFDRGHIWAYLRAKAVKLQLF